MGALVALACLGAPLVLAPCLSAVTCRVHLFALPFFFMRRRVVLGGMTARRLQAEQGPDGDMGGFTRILHSGREDHLMHEIPTVVVDRLQNEHGFVVLSRPNAFVQWLKQVSTRSLLPIRFVSPVGSLSVG